MDTGPDSASASHSRIALAKGAQRLVHRAPPVRRRARRRSSHGRARGASRFHSRRTHRPACSGQRSAPVVSFQAMAVVQQAVVLRLLPGKVDADLFGCARRASRENAAQFGARSGNRYAHRVGSTIARIRSARDRAAGGGRAASPQPAAAMLGRSPGLGEVARGIDERHVRERLRKIAQHRPRLGSYSSARRPTSLHRRAGARRASTRRPCGRRGHASASQNEQGRKRPSAGGVFSSEGSVR